MLPCAQQASGRDAVSGQGSGDLAVGGLRFHMAHSSSGDLRNGAQPHVPGSPGPSGRGDEPQHARSESLGSDTHLQVLSWAAQPAVTLLACLCNESACLSFRPTFCALKTPFQSQLPCLPVHAATFAGLGRAAWVRQSLWAGWIASRRVATIKEYKLLRAVWGPRVQVRPALPSKQLCSADAALTNVCTAGLFVNLFYLKYMSSACTRVDKVDVDCLLSWKQAEALVVLVCEQGCWRRRSGSRRRAVDAERGARRIGAAEQQR